MSEETLRSYADKNDVRHWTLKGRADTDPEFPVSTRELGGARVYESSAIDEYLKKNPITKGHPWYKTHARWVEKHPLKRPDMKAVRRAIESSEVKWTNDNEYGKRQRGTTYKPVHTLDETQMKEFNATVPVSIDLNVKVHAENEADAEEKILNALMNIKVESLCDPDAEIEEPTMDWALSATTVEFYEPIEN